jgi:hypothetical protein
MENPSQIIIVLFVCVAILIAAFLILRELNCWYWKINERIKLQKEIIFLLKKLVPQGESDITSSVKEIQLDPKKKIFDSLTDEEKQIIDELRMQGLGIGDKIIMHKTLRNILKVSSKEWKSYGSFQSEWIILIQ